MKKYFTEDTEKAIVEYNNSQDSVIRSRIYAERIHYPFFKLTQNMIHTFKFYYTDVENLEDLQHEVIIHLLDKIHMFNPEKGSKAYSYFGMITKNYLIHYNNNNYKALLKTQKLGDLKNSDSLIYDDGRFSQKENLREFVKIFSQHYSEENNIGLYFYDKEEVKIVLCVLELFDRVEYLDSLFEKINKKALYLYIREITDLKSQKVSRTINKFSNLFYKEYDFFRTNGFYSFE
jgi:hypothetical protein